MRPNIHCLLFSPPSHHPTRPSLPSLAVTCSLANVLRESFLVRGMPSVLWRQVNNPGRRQLEWVGEAHLSPGGANRLHLLLLGHQTEHTHIQETQWRDSGQTCYCTDMRVTILTVYRD